MREILHRILPAGLLQEARHDVAAEMERNPGPDFAQKGRIRLSWFDSTAINAIARRLSAHAGLPFRADRSGAQLQRPDGSHHQGWHQDLPAIGGLVGFTMWVPLDPIDGTRPTLEFAGEAPAQDSEYEAQGFSNEDMRGVAFVPTVIDRLELGDVVMFGPLELHRTYCDASMTQPRLSLDLRFLP